MPQKIRPWWLGYVLASPIRRLWPGDGEGPGSHDGDRRTEDGFETAFAANHLVHYLVLRLLMPRLARDDGTGRIAISWR
jgi:hypothetical protein